MTTFLNADTIVGGAIITADASGSLGLQAAGSTVLTLNANNANFGKPILETATASATAATGTVNFDALTQQVLYYTSNASGNWTLNVRGSSGVSLNTVMSTGQSLTIAFFVTQGATAYYNNVVQVDGSTVTPKYQGGTAWSAGNASSIDAYTYTIVKTGNAAFTVFAAQTRFA
jgi:hypothetical protein